MTTRKKNEDKNKQEYISAPEPSFIVRMRNYFLTGVLITGPILITFYLAWAFVTFIDDAVSSIIPAQYNPETYLRFSLPGFGLLIVAIVLILVGMFAANFMGRFFVNLSDRLLNRMPILRGIYSATKQIMETVFSKQSKAFRDVVLVEYPRRGMWVIGFVTGKTKGEVQNSIKHELLNVFIPTTPNPTSGFLIFIPVEDAYPVHMTVEEGIKLVISGGIVAPPDKRPESAKEEPHIASKELLAQDEPPKRSQKRSAKKKKDI